VTDFYDSDSILMVSSLELPLNVEPINDEKSYEIAELWTGVDTNLVGNLVTVGLQADGRDKGGVEISLYDESRSGNIIVVVPLHSIDQTATVAQTAKMTLYYALNKPFTITELRVQYAVDESVSSRIKSRVKQ